MSAGGAAGIPAGQLTAREIEDALGTLRRRWADGYTFGYDPERGWWVIRNGRIGSLLTAGSAGELDSKMEAAFGTAAP